MKLEINGASLDVPQDYVKKLSEDLWKLIEQLYEAQIPDVMKTGLMIPVRAMLVQEEMSVRMKYGKEAARLIRPPAKADVNLWLFRKFLPYVLEQLNGSTITCETSGETVTAFNIQLENHDSTGGQLGTHRDAGERQDDRANIS